MSERMEKLNRLMETRSLIEAGGGEDFISQMHSAGRLTARERISALLDESTFVEFGAFMKQRATDFNAQAKDTPADGVVTGYGTVDGRLVFLYSQDSGVLGGSVGEIHAKKICSVYDQALKMGAPVIAILDSAGMRLQEGVDAFDAYGMIYRAMSNASGVIPQITVVLGNCMGSASIIPALSDFVFMTEKDAKLFLQTPAALPGESGKADYEITASAKTVAEKSGLVHFIEKTEESCLAQVRALLDYLPSNNMEDAPFFGVSDDLNREDVELNDLIPESKEEAVDLEAILQIISDHGQFYPIQKEYGTGILLGFARFNGYTTGLIGTVSGTLCSTCIQKASRFVSFCDAFNIPLVSFLDAGGFSPEDNQGLLAQSAAKLVYTFASATTPKINVILRRGFGNPYLIFNSKHIGADLVLAWPQAEVAVMDAEAAVNVMYAQELKNAEDGVALKAEKIAQYGNQQASPYLAASRGYIDDIIQPVATRKRIAAALEMLSSKRESKPAKKHSSFFL